MSTVMGSGPKRRSTDERDRAQAGKHTGLGPNPSCLFLCVLSTTLDRGYASRQTGRKATTLRVYGLRPSGRTQGEPELRQSRRWTRSPVVVSYVLLHMRAHSCKMVGFSLSLVCIGRELEPMRRCRKPSVRHFLPSQHKMRMSGFVSVAIFLLKQQRNGSSCMLSTEGLLHDARGRLYGSLIPTAIIR